MKNCRNVNFQHTQMAFSNEQFLSCLSPQWGFVLLVNHLKKNRTKNTWQRWQNFDIDNLIKQRRIRE